MLKELPSDYWSHEPCQGIQDVEVACCCWAVYICGRAEINTKGGVNRGPTMIGPGAALRAYCYEKWCCYCRPELD
jgi:hypothetical protein